MIECLRKVLDSVGKDSECKDSICEISPHLCQEKIIGHADTQVHNDSQDSCDPYQQVRCSPYILGELVLNKELCFYKKNCLP